uniref:F-box domain-containing protein n=1 Tax=Panagrolaimus davidi TaxID=227884 RepID=A0A914PK39_9BILA
MLKFDSTNCFIQDFSLPSPIIRYLMINANPENLKKLYKTCKYFYSEFQLNIVEDLILNNEELLDKPGPYEIFLYNHQLDKLPNNLWLVRDLLIGDNLNLSQFFSKIVRCDLREIYIYVSTKFTLNEFKILTRSETVKEVFIDMPIYISYEGDEKVPLEDILSCVLSAYRIVIDNCYVTKNTMEK